MTLLSLRGVTRRYGAVTAVDAVDLDVPAGSRTSIVGASGSGKTTLLRLVCGFEAPDAGQIVLDGQVVADGAAIVPAHRRGIGIVTQDGGLFPHLSIADNIGFGLPRGLADRADRIRRLMEMVELDPAMLRRRPDALSGGQQQRVGLARALARKPRLMLLDEPFSALDAGLRAHTRKAVGELLQAAAITTILVTHDQAEALSFADQVAVMGEGRLLQVGPPQALYRYPHTPAIAEFLGDAIILPARLVDGVAESPLGRVAVAGDARSGDATIMLRPEQVVMSAGAAGTVTAEVIELEFGGTVCMLRLRLPARDGWPARDLWLRRTPLEAPCVGTAVGLSVTAAAHVFAG